MESPENTKHLKHIMKAIQNRMDWVMNYRLDSDVVTPYGYTKHRIFPVPKRVIKHKKREIAWMVSNCDTPSNREKFAEQLSNYVNVDIYGHCGKFNCPKEEYYKNLRIYYYFNFTQIKEYYLLLLVYNLFSRNESIQNMKLH
ncbi:alpha-(1:3)-fucosyltransferase C-like protein [Leptotrombidium deliense]|uniref:Fucosyltransferase n=1 Tax=Leptotrombidium deliense TaxID=299467 RepID=A0A443SGV8_9ACAR|nr:alpha-(1:3)-fucosyltransferase C-like protein [Leptotrombidium deliense]